MTRKFFLWKCKYNIFRLEKNYKKPQFYFIPKKKNPEWITIKKKTIDPNRFMKMLWLVRENWYFQKLIGSRMALRWSDTAQFMEHFTTALNNTAIHMVSGPSVNIDYPWIDLCQCWTMCEHKKSVLVCLFF